MAKIKIIIVTFDKILPMKNVSFEKISSETEEKKVDVASDDLSKV